MCTAVTYKTAASYFGRTLDIEFTYPKQVIVTPRNYVFNFRKAEPVNTHYAIIGMAMEQNGYPLYFEGANEMGLAMAGLNFPGNAVYYPEKEGKANITPFEFIPWILGKCKNLDEARALLDKINLCNINYSENLPLSPLHWIIADKNGAITVETTKDGMKVFENPVGVLTNNPTFDYHMTHLNEFLNVTAKMPENRFGGGELKPFSMGMGGLGLPGDLSSASRFVKVAFTKLNSVSGDGEEESVGQFFHILSSVEHQRGCVIAPNGNYEITEYTCCINTDKGVYYYTTYENSQITAVDMHKCDLNGSELYIYPLVLTQQIFKQN